MIKRHLILDISNLAYRTFFANWKNSEAKDILTGLCHQGVLIYMNFYYKKYKPDNVVVAFDSHSWRKSYTKDLSTCVTHKKYKGQRRKDLTDSEQEMLDKFDEHLNEFYECLRKRTSMVILKGDHLEADDLIAGWVQNHEDDDNIIISADKDFIQLMSNPNVTLIDPISKKERDLSEWDDDAELFMFQKCIRGDASDNVQSSYPRLQMKKIKKALNDDFLYNNIMKHEFTVLDVGDDSKAFEHEYVTEDLFHENKLLMDLTEQPKPIKKMIKKSIKHAKDNRGKFDYYNFMRYCSRNDMVKISDGLEQFKDMLSNKS